METLEFLGGKYQKTEQIVPGPVQTFRAREAASGREVFVHRVSSTEEQAEQTTLLRMLTTVLLRSAEARKLVLDFGDDQGFWYVVTESEPRCLILREWLQFELHRAAAGPAAEKHAPAKPVPEPPAVPVQPQASQAPPQALPIQPQALKLQQETTQPGEFTRMFEASPRMSSPAPVFTPPIQPEKISVAPPSAAPATQNEPGEFTRVFQTFAPAQPLAPTPVQPDTAPMPPAAPATQNEPGEFTRFFQEGLPRPAGKSVSNPEVKRNPEKLSRGGFVQRPHTPMPPVPQKPSEPGEFTRMFSHPTADGPKSRDLFADYPDAKPEPAKLFSGAEMPKATPPKQQEPGEYTRIFGGGTAPLPEPPRPQQPFPESARAPASADDPLHGTKPLTVPPAMPAAAPKGPSEYTMVIQGNRPVEAGGSPAPAALAGGNAASPLALPKLPAAPQLKVPSVAVPKPPTIPAPAQINAVAAASNKKLIIFFGILAVLAVVLILLIVLIAFKK